VPTTTTTTTIKNIYTARESIELFGDRWKVIQLLANDFVYKEYIQNKGCSPTPCNRDYWAVTSIKDSLYYKNENYWIVNVILEFRNLEEQKIWYEYFNVTVDQATGSVLNYQKI
jgi:uncharacterized protein YerC